jgi:hypothetical protein
MDHGPRVGLYRFAVAGFDLSILPNADAEAPRGLALAHRPTFAMASEHRGERRHEKRLELAPDGNCLRRRITSRGAYLDVWQRAVDQIRQAQKGEHLPRRLDDQVLAAREFQRPEERTEP